jgi:hypothetical protein
MSLENGSALVAQCVLRRGGGRFAGLPERVCEIIGLRETGTKVVSWTNSVSTTDFWSVCDYFFSQCFLDPWCWLFLPLSIPLWLLSWVCFLIYSRYEYWVLCEADLKVVTKKTFGENYDVRSWPLLNIQRCTAIECRTIRSSHVMGQISVGPDGVGLKNYQSFVQAILHQQAIVQSQVTSGFPSNTSRPVDNVVCAIADAGSISSSSPVPIVQATTMPRLGEAIVLKVSSNCGSGSFPFEGDEVTAQQNSSTTRFGGFYARIPVGSGSDINLPDGVRTKAGLRGTKVLFWTTFDPLLEERLSSSYFFWNGCAPVFVTFVVTCLWPLLILCYPAAWAEERAGEARRTIWILCEREIKIVMRRKDAPRLIDSVTSIPMDDIRACTIDDTFIVVEQVTTASEGSPLVGRAAGMKQHKWFAQAILNQISVCKSQPQQPQSGPAVTRATATTEISRDIPWANVVPDDESPAEELNRPWTP